MELGTGAGQDGLWFHSQGFDTTLTDATNVAFDSIKERSKNNIKISQVDITESLPFQDNSFDVVYAHLVLHYFNDEAMKSIISEIQRVLCKEGLLACMVNSTKDPEYDRFLENNEHLIGSGKIQKRYFSTASFLPFVAEFSTVVIDDNGRTPKDNEVGTSGLVRFLGKNNLGQDKLSRQQIDGVL